MALAKRWELGRNYGGGQITTADDGVLDFSSVTSGAEIIFLRKKKLLSKELTTFWGAREKKFNKKLIVSKMKYIYVYQLRTGFSVVSRWKFRAAIFDERSARRTTRRCILLNMCDDFFAKVLGSTCAIYFTMKTRGITSRFNCGLGGVGYFSFSFSNLQKIHYEFAIRKSPFSPPAKFPSSFASRYKFTYSKFRLSILPLLPVRRTSICNDVTIGR